MDVVEMQRTVIDVDIDALHAARLARLPRDVVLEVMRDRKAAENGVAELMTAELPRRRVHPTHAERRAELFRVSPSPRAGADDFLQRDDVSIDRAEHGRNAVGPRAAVESATAVHV